MSFSGEAGGDEVLPTPAGLHHPRSGEKYSFSRSPFSHSSFVEHLLCASALVFTPVKAKRGSSWKIQYVAQNQY